MAADDEAQGVDGSLSLSLPVMGRRADPASLDKRPARDRLAGM